MKSTTITSDTPPLESVILSKKSDEEFGKPVGTPVDEERVRACFERDLDIAERECEHLYGEREFGSFPEQVQQILVNMMFNMGRPEIKSV